MQITNIERFDGEWISFTTGTQTFDKLFSGVRITSSSGEKYYFPDPVVAKITGDKISLTGGGCKCFEFLISDTPYTFQQLKDILDGNSNHDDTDTWDNTTRPSTPYPGQDGYNTDSNTREYWNTANWIQY